MIDRKKLSAGDVMVCPDGEVVIRAEHAEIGSVTKFCAGSWGWRTDHNVAYQAGYRCHADALRALLDRVNRND